MWNAADKSSNVVLSNATFTMAANTTATCGVRAAVPLGAAKYYWECNATGAAANLFMGICKSTATLAPGGSTDYVQVFSDGNVWSNSSTMCNIGSWSTPVTICFAVDHVADQMWVRKNGGSWNGVGTADPATASGSFSITAFHASAVPVANVSGATTPTITAVTSGFSFTAPAGFGAIPLG
jgi:hypothetical protein